MKILRSNLMRAATILAVLAMVSLACSLGSAATPEAQPTPTSPPPPAEEPTPVPVEEPTVASSQVEEQAPISPIPEEPGEPAQAGSGEVSLSSPDGILSLEKAYYYPGQTMEVFYQLSAPLESDDWVGIIPSDAPHGSVSENDANDVGYAYMGEETAGVVIIIAPPLPGLYDLRLNDASEDQEISSLSFEVLPHDASQVQLSLDKSIYGPGGEMVLSYVVPDTLPEDAWFGILPIDAPHGSASENDANDLGWAYLGGSLSGTLSFYAPGEPGSYDLRLNDTTGGTEMADVKFEVQAHDAGQAGLSLSKTTFAPGEEIVLNFTAPPTLPENAWIGMLPADAPHGSETEADQFDLSYEYLQGSVSGTLNFYAPDEPGVYEFRMYDTDKNGSELTALSFTVQ